MKSFVGGFYIGHGNNLGDIRRLITDTLHVGYHFKSRGNCAQIARYRLLLK